MSNIQTEDYPVCAKKHTPDAETINLMREDGSILKIKLPIKWFVSLDDIWDDTDDDDL